MPSLAQSRPSFRRGVCRDVGSPSEQYRDTRTRGSFRAICGIYHMDTNTTCKSVIPSTSMNGIAGKKMRFSSLPGIFEDFKDVESDWYTLAVLC
jgi:hypothetical protein